MRDRRHEIMLYRREDGQLTLERLAATTEIHPGLVELFVANGLLEPVEEAGSLLLFDVASVPRLQMIMRLKRDTGVNLAGIGMILDLLDRFHALEQENQWLRARL